MRKLSLLLTVCVFISLPVMAKAWNDQTAAELRDILASEQRSDEHRARDANRKPLETLAFFGLRNDMSVVEMIPGKGWYTRILAPLLRDKGKLYLSIGTRRLEPALFEKGIISKSDIVGKVEGFRQTDMPGFIFDIDSVDMQVQNVDMVLTFRNVHNFSAGARKLINEAAFAALKPGGIYGIIDHTKRHMEAFNETTWRRIDPVLIIKEALDAGFEFEAYSDLHAVAADELVHDTLHEAVKTNSDRFTLKFRKPLKP